MAYYLNSACGSYLISGLSFLFQVCGQIFSNTTFLQERYYGDKMKKALMEKREVRWFKVFRCGGLWSELLENRLISEMSTQINNAKVLFLSFILP